MKHALRIFAAGAALLAVACTKEQSDGERIPESFPSDSHYVNVDEARAAVETMLGSMDPETRGGAVRSITGVVTIGGPGDTRGGASDSPVYHVFSLGDGEGFALASGDDRTPPVFCITDSGTFEEIAETGNPGLGMTLLSYDINYRVAVGLPIPDEGDGMIYPGEPGYPSASAYGSGGGITDVDIDYGGGRLQLGTGRTVSPDDADDIRQQTRLCRLRCGGRGANPLPLRLSCEHRRLCVGLE